MKYIITGATGGLGSQVLKYLLRLVPATDIIVSLHNPNGASSQIVSSGVEIRHGDYGDPSTLDEAFRGGDKVLIISYPNISGRIPYHVNAIDAAKRCGIKHVYYTSLMFASDSVAAVMQDHLASEKYLKESGLTYTILREGIYSESYPLYFGFFDPNDGSDEVLIPHGDGGIAWVSREDLGEGTAKIMVSDGYVGETLLLSGSRVMTLHELAQRISAILHREIKLCIVDEERYLKRNIGKDGRMGEEKYLRQWVSTFISVRRGELEIVDPLLQNVLGRKLKPIEETLVEMLRGGSADAR
ncbi:NmrA-like family protein [Laetiporus sulphureus 93-53]|uniref:NmrA-like family protein n=1 Tax=Laetiporus sulphureus 93-53 TaxID=1314785 RepID=A0A165DER9_9APHY|nr:NmrA-like family protein [Laetiporus sulphureus 93-53]KZT04727.1 NmrA-like family protein [Laetiporus sulphureus 93-53]